MVLVRHRDAAAADDPHAAYGTVGVDQVAGKTEAPVTPNTSTPAAAAVRRWESVTVLPVKVMFAPDSVAPSSPWPSMSCR